MKKILSISIVLAMIISAIPLAGFVGMNNPFSGLLASADETEFIDYSYLTQNQYMAKILLNHNYKGCASPINEAEDTIPQGQLRFWTNTSNTSTSRVLRNRINENVVFLESVAAWKALTFDPAEAYENLLKEEDYYTTIFMSILNSKMEDNEYLDAWNCSTNKTILSLSKAATDYIEEAYSQEFKDLRTIDTSSFTDREFHELMIDITNTKEGRALYEYLGEDINIIEKASEGLETIYDVVQMVSTYSTIANLNKATEDVLAEMYNKCPDGTPMKAAAKKVYEVSTEQMSKAFFASLEAGEALVNATFKFCAGKVWDLALTGILGSFGSGFKFGQAIGKSISNFLFSTDRVIEQYYVLDATVKIEDVMIGTINSLASKFKADESAENADAYMKSIEMLFSLYDLGCDYTLSFATTAKQKGLYNTIKSWFGKDETLESYRESISSIKLSIEDMKHTLTTIEGYRWYYEIDAPTAYAECFEVPEELPKEKPAYSDTKEIVNVYPDIKPETNSGVFFTYKIKPDKTIVITGCNPSAIGEVYIPKDIGGIAVREIGANAFENCTGITSIVTESTLYNIGASAFRGCTGLTNIALKAGLKTIGKKAFHGTALTSVTVPKTVTNMSTSGSSCFNGAESLKKVVFEYGILKIPDYALENCKSVTNVVLPEGITQIGSYAFSGCTGLTSIDLPASIQTISSYAFSGCTGLTSIDLPQMTQTIGASAFRGCSNLLNVDLNSGLKNIGASAFSGTALTSITVPGTVTSMNTNSSSCFSGANSLGKVIFEQGISLIPNYALKNCESVTTIVIPDGVTNIGHYAFDGCTGLKSIDLPSSIQTIGSYAFSNCTGLTSIDLPQMTQTIGASAFRGCSNLLSVDLNSGLKNIGASAFSGTALTSITVPGTVTSMNTNSSSCFNGANSLEKVVFEQGISPIPSYALKNCKSVTTVVIPDSVTIIRSYAFDGCTSLTDVYYTGSEEDWNKITIEKYNESLLNANIHFNYKEKTYTVTYYDGDTILAQYSVKENQAVPKISNPEKPGNSFIGWDKEIPDVMPSENLEFYAQWWTKYYYNIVFIVDGETYKIDSLRPGASIIVPSDPQKDGYIFKGWTPSIPATMPDYDLEFTAVWDVDNSRPILASGNCGERCADGWEDNLTWILYEDGEMVISGSGEMGTMNAGGPWENHKDEIIKLTVNEGAVNIGASAFSYCENLSSVILPETVLTIGESAFKQCDLRYTFEMPGVQIIDAYAFSHAKIVGTIVLPESLLRIEECAFEYTQMWSIDIPENVVYISDSAFVGCDQIYAIYVEHGNLNYADDSGVLYDINKTILMQYPVYKYGDSYTLPETVLKINKGAFQMSRIKNVYLNENLTSIGEGAFERSKIKTIIIPESINAIEKGTFHSCYYLESVTIPSSIKTIGTSAFAWCEALTDVYFNGTEAEWNSIVIGENNEKLLNAVIHFITPDACRHSSVEEITILPTCQAQGIKYNICVYCGEQVGDSVILPIIDHEMIVFTIDATCEVDGITYETCKYCGKTGKSEIIPAEGHVPGDWQIVKPATTTEPGERIRKCIKCSKIVVTEEIPPYKIVSDPKTDISVVYSPDKYDDELDLIVNESNDGSVFAVVNAQTGSHKLLVYDIRILLNGNEIQPIGEVTVRIPVPEDYNISQSYVHHVDTQTGKLQKMNTVVETIDGKHYLVFTTTHFSYYTIVDETKINVSVKNPSTTTINYGDSIWLHAEIEGELPEGAKIIWTPSNNNFQVVEVSADGLSCKITPVSSGTTTFTVSVVDANEKVLSTDTQDMNSKAGLWQKIVAFFKKLFGATKTYPELYKGIF